MILALDTYYFNGKAKTVGLIFDSWTDATEKYAYSETIESLADYEPGEFYKKELPCILSLINTYHLDGFEAIVVDGFVYLDDGGKLGLGGRLYEALEQKVPIIGVAKTNFFSIKEHKRALLRGDSLKPLFITAIGINLDVATEKIKIMNGDFRIPSLLKRLDVLTKTPNE